MDIWIKHLKDRMIRYNFVISVLDRLGSYLEGDNSFYCNDSQKISFSFKKKYMKNPGFTDKEWENYFPADFLYVSAVDEQLPPNREKNHELAYVNYAFISKNSIDRLEKENFNLNNLQWDVCKVIVYTPDATDENLEKLIKHITTAWETSFTIVRNILKARQKYIKECKIKSIIVDEIDMKGTNVGV